MNEKISLFIALLVVVCIVFGGCIGGSNLKIIDHKLEVVMGSSTSHYYQVVGTVQNIGSSKVTHGRVEIKFYDKDKVVLGTGGDFIDDLNPGEIGKFSVPFYTTGSSVVANYTISAK